MSVARSSRIKEVRYSSPDLFEGISMPAVSRPSQRGFLFSPDVRLRCLHIALYESQKRLSPNHRCRGWLWTFDTHSRHGKLGELRGKIRAPGLVVAITPVHRTCAATSVTQTNYLSLANVISSGEVTEAGIRRAEPNEHAGLRTSTASLFFAEARNIPEGLRQWYYCGYPLVWNDSFGNRLFAMIRTKHHGTLVAGWLGSCSSATSVFVGYQGTSAIDRGRTSFLLGPYIELVQVAAVHVQRHVPRDLISHVALVGQPITVSFQLRKLLDPLQEKAWQWAAQKKPKRKADVKNEAWNKWRNLNSPARILFPTYDRKPVPAWEHARGGSLAVKDGWLFQFVGEAFSCSEEANETMEAGLTMNAQWNAVKDLFGTMHLDHRPPPFGLVAGDTLPMEASHVAMSAGDPLLWRFLSGIDPEAATEAGRQGLHGMARHGLDEDPKMQRAGSEEVPGSSSIQPTRHSIGCSMRPACMLWRLNFARQLTAFYERGMDLPVSVFGACRIHLERGRYTRSPEARQKYYQPSGRTIGRLLAREQDAAGLDNADCIAVLKRQTYTVLCSSYTYVSIVLESSKFDEHRRSGPERTSIHSVWELSFLMSPCRLLEKTVTKMRSQNVSKGRDKRKTYSRGSGSVEDTFSKRGPGKPQGEDGDKEECGCCDVVCLLALLCLHDWAGLGGVEQLRITLRLIITASIGCRFETRRTRSFFCLGLRYSEKLRVVETWELVATQAGGRGRRELDRERKGENQRKKRNEKMKSQFWLASTMSKRLMLRLWLNLDDECRPFPYLPPPIPITTFIPALVPRKEIPSSSLSILRKKGHKHSSTPPEPSPPLLKLGPGAEYVACLPKPSEARSIKYDTQFQIHTVEGTHLPSSSLPFPALRLAPDSERYAAYRTLKHRRVHRAAVSVWIR
ncbi:hypothetical protein CCUS01_14586 [Colletotrichum cuscutae]|uniref:Uncharacterized protein n=1 Tax=Colletotrichum cuscutae TaxID=1209917 RepID=A0AAJ0DL26_9PEZI|nr:hypothetical protein CCUS01_14586 [Colletotrichum cuscutae]